MIYSGIGINNLDKSIVRFWFAVEIMAIYGDNTVTAKHRIFTMAIHVFFPGLLGCACNVLPETFAMTGLSAPSRRFSGARN